MALDLGLKSWTLAFLGGALGKARVVTIKARDFVRLERELGKARKRAELAEDAAVKSCFEAGRDGFWLYRVLRSKGIETLVVDSSSIERNRRAQSAKTDRIDATKLVEMLYRHHFESPGRAGWSIVRVPGVAEEDARQAEREREQLVRERGRCRNRIESDLARLGIYEFSFRGLEARLAKMRGADGALLPPHHVAALQRGVERLEQVNAQLAALESERRADLEQAQNEPAKDKTPERIAATLMQLRGIGESALTLAREFGWRDFKSGRPVGAAAGMVPCPWRSGQLNRQNGISGGNGRVRRVIVQVAWGWLRFQPDSALSRWFRERFGRGRRSTKVGIIALARKLLIALWKLWTTGEIPEGAICKPVTA
jgi:transposase